MSAENNKAVKSDESQNPKQTVDTSRRSFAKASAVFAPVMMTLANRSAWGGTNICTESGWNSYQGQNGNVSHAAHVKNAAWKKPSDTSTMLGWHETTSWPSAFGIATDSGGGAYTSSLWTDTKDFSGVQGYESTNHVVLLVATLFPIDYVSSTLTLFDALVGGNLLSYRVATVLNNAMSPVPSYFMGTAATLEQYQDFYLNCV